MSCVISLLKLHKISDISLGFNTLSLCLTERQREVYHKVCRKVNHDMSNSFSVFVMRLRDLQGEESVSAFARRLQIKQQTLDACIKGQRKPSAELIYKVACNCHVSADWLLGLTDQRSPFIEVPRENNVSKTAENEDKFPSFIRPICRSVRQYYKNTTNGAEKQERKDQEDVCMHNRLDSCGSADDWRLLRAAGSRRVRNDLTRA